MSTTTGYLVSIFLCYYISFKNVLRNGCINFTIAQCYAFNHSQMICRQDFNLSLASLLKLNSFLPISDPWPDSNPSREILVGELKSRNSYMKVSGLRRSAGFLGHVWLKLQPERLTRPEIKGWSGLAISVTYLCQSVELWLLNDSVFVALKILQCSKQIKVFSLTG